MEHFEQILSLMCHVQSGIGMEEHHTIIKKTGLFCWWPFASFSAWCSTCLHKRCIPFPGSPPGTHMMSPRRRWQALCQQMVSLQTSFWVSWTVSTPLLMSYWWEWNNGSVSSSPATTSRRQLLPSAAQGCRELRKTIILAALLYLLTHEAPIWHRPHCTLTHHHSMPYCAVG